MVCSPHQYIVQRIAVGYQMKPSYQTEIRYQAPATYNFVAPPQRYESQTEKLTPATQYNPLRQYHLKYQPQDQQSHLVPNVKSRSMFVSPLRVSEKVTSPIKEKAVAHWHDYGLPLYIAEIKEPPQNTMKRKELHELIQRELESLRIRQMEGTLCAA